MSPSLFAYLKGNAFGRTMCTVIFFKHCYNILVSLTSDYLNRTGHVESKLTPLTHTTVENLTSWVSVYCGTIFTIFTATILSKSYSTWHLYTCKILRKEHKNMLVSNPQMTVIKIQLFWWNLKRRRVYSYSVINLQFSVVLEWEHINYPELNVTTKAILISDDKFLIRSQYLLRRHKLRQLANQKHRDPLNATLLEQYHSF